MAIIVPRKVYHARKQIIAMCTLRVHTLKTKENTNAFAIPATTEMGIDARL